MSKENFGVEIIGANELTEAFKVLPANIQTNLVKSTFRRIGSPYVKDIRNEFVSVKKNKGTGELVKAIGYKVFRNGLGIIVGFRADKSHSRGHLAHLIDRGTNDRFYTTRKNSLKKSTGKLKSTNFFEKATGENYSKSELEISSTIESVINKWIIKNNNKL